MYVIMEDKLYISVLNFKNESLWLADKLLREYLELGISPILTETDILMSVYDYAKTITERECDGRRYEIYDKCGHQIPKWYIEMEIRVDGVVQGKLIGKGIGCMRFVAIPPGLLRSGITVADPRYHEMIQRMSGRLGIVVDKL